MIARLAVAATVAIIGIGCAAPAGLDARPLASPSDVEYSATATAADRKDCPSVVTVAVVKPLHGSVGYTWVKATYTGGDQAQAPVWTISEGADIMGDQDAGHELYAYIMAPTGKYTVHATGPCGVVGEATVDHVIVER